MSLLPDIGALITEAIQSDKRRDLRRWAHGPWYESSHRSWPAWQCARCGMKSLSGWPDPDDKWTAWCLRRPYDARD
jgi:hypothetical protein